MGCCNSKATDRRSQELIGCWPCCSHPHGKRCNVVAGSLAIVAILLAICQCLVFYWYVNFWQSYFKYNSSYTRQWTAAWIFSAVAACVGTIAMVVTFTATCRAYRQCGVKAVSGLYILCFICQLISLLLAVTDHNLYCWADRWDGYPDMLECRAATLGFSIACLFLWGVCAVCAFFVPPHSANNETRMVSPSVSSRIFVTEAVLVDEEEAK